ncbi:MAG: hypothetical protein WC943_13690 [Elusimicrobiota bacterium]|jgi:hypothetical protein
MTTTMKGGVKEMRIKMKSRGTPARIGPLSQRTKTSAGPGTTDVHPVTLRWATWVVRLEEEARAELEAKNLAAAQSTPFLKEPSTA